MTLVAEHLSDSASTPRRGRARGSTTCRGALEAGRTLAIVGESGRGKTVMSLGARSACSRPGVSVRHLPAR